MNIFWFRRDLRLEDDSGLHHALDRERACDKAQKPEKEH
ncbi:deoxyribodipyrimidine photo-lyase [Chryseobacterium sp. WG23]